MEITNNGVQTENTEKEGQGLSFQETYVVTEFEDSGKISFLIPSNQEQLEKVLESSDSRRVLIETDDIMKLGPVGLVLVENQGIPNNPYAGHYFEESDDSEEEYQEPKGDYQLEIIDLSKTVLPGVNDEEGLVVCAIRERVNGHMVLSRIPVEQIAEINPMVPEDKDGAVKMSVRVRELSEELKTNNNLNVSEKNEKRLELDRLISGVWVYWGKSTDAVDINELLPGIYDEVTIGENIGEITGFVNDDKNWKEDKAESNQWKAKSVIKSMLGNITAQGKDANFEEIGMDLMTVSEKVVSTPEVFWKMIKPVVDEMVLRGVSMESVRDMLNSISLNISIDEIDEVAKIIGE